LLIRRSLLIGDSALHSIQSSVPPGADTPPELLPDGFWYQPEFLSIAEEQQLLQQISMVAFHPFDFHGYQARRRIVVYGWDYNFTSREAAETEPIPDYLIPLRNRAAEFAGIERLSLVEAVVTEYPPGAPIGWHRDVPQFEDVIGVSLASPCRMRLKPYSRKGSQTAARQASRSKIVSITLEPRSIYLLRGAARWHWQHSIPAVERLRYSITFRTLRAKTRQHEAA
jgi:alkylated DNA repair dioxygenase AlkB